MDIDKIKKLANIYHKELLKRVPKERLEDELVKKLEIKVEQLSVDKVKELVLKSIKLLGEEKVLDILEIDPNDLNMESEPIMKEMNSFDEVAKFIKDNVNEPTTMKNGFRLVKELRKHLIELDELPQIGVQDDVLVLSWYEETSYGIAVGINKESVAFMDAQHGEISNTREYVIGDELIDDIVDHINIVNYDGKVQ